MGEIRMGMRCNADIALDCKTAAYAAEAAFIAQKKIELCHLPQSMFSLIFKTELENVCMRAEINALSPPM